MCAGGEQARAPSSSQSIAAIAIARRRKDKGGGGRRARGTDIPIAEKRALNRVSLDCAIPILPGAQETNMEGNTLKTPDRRTLLAGIGGLAAGTFLATRRADAGPLEPPSSPASTQKPLSSIEPRTALGPETTPGNVTALFRITAPGSYYLTENLVGEQFKYAIAIEASNVALDLNGFEISGTGLDEHDFAAIRVFDSASNVRIANGSIVNWPGPGMDARSASWITVSGLGVFGSDFADAIMVGEHGHVHDCIASSRFVAIIAGPGSRVENCRASSLNGDGIQIGEGGQVLNCSVITGFVSGVSIQGAGAHVVGCDIRGVGVANGAGVYVGVGSDSVIEGNIITASVIGIKVTTAGNLVIGNRLRTNTTHFDIVADNNVGPIITAPLSGAILGSAGAAGVGTTDPYANIVF
jgi:hypothetical protein